MFNSVIKLDQYEVISPKQEHELALRYYETGDIRAAKKLTLGHLKFVAHMSYKYNHFGFSQSDLFQEGCIGLMKAIKNFNPHKGVKLITFASYWIRAEIHEYILKNWHIVKIATTKVQRKLFFGLNKQLEKMRQADGKVNYTALAKKMKVKESDIKEMEGRLSGSMMPIEDFTQNRDTVETTNKEVIDPAEIYAQNHDSQSTKTAIMTALKTLDKRSLDVVQKRWLSESKVPLRELSKSYGVSMERVRQIELEAFAKMRSVLPNLK